MNTGDVHLQIINLPSALEARSISLVEPFFIELRNRYNKVAKLQENEMASEG